MAFVPDARHPLKALVSWQPAVSQQPRRRAPHACPLVAPPVARTSHMAVARACVIAAHALWARPFLPDRHQQPPRLPCCLVR